MIREGDGAAVPECVDEDFVVFNRDRTDVRAHVERALLELNAILIVDARAFREDEQTVVVGIADVLLDTRSRGDSVVGFSAVEPAVAKAIKHVRLEETDEARLFLTDETERVLLAEYDDVNERRVVSDVDAVGLVLRYSSVVSYDSGPAKDENAADEADKRALIMCASSRRHKRFERDE